MMMSGHLSSLTPLLIGGWHFVKLLHSKSTMMEPTFSKSQAGEVFRDVSDQALNCGLGGFGLNS